MQTTTTVAATVRAEMARNRITQTKLAEHLHMSQAAVSRRLKGDVAFNADELATVSTVVGVPVGAFFGERAA